MAVENFLRLFYLQEERMKKFMLKTIKQFAKKPAMYEKSEAKFWDDPYISQRMLEAHLNPDLESATRKIGFVRKSVDWISAIVPPTQHKRLLDLGCGPGIYAELFFNKGYQVTGLDLSQNSIQYAKKNAREKSLDIEYLNGDYIESPLVGEYDLITMIYCDFGVLSGNERQLLLSKIHDILSPKGCFIFDVFTPFEYAGREAFKKWSYEDSGFWSANPYLLLQSLYRYDEGNTFLNQYIVATDSLITCYNLWEHTFTIEELNKDLLKAGFKNMRYCGDVAGVELRNNNKTLCVIAEK